MGPDRDDEACWVFDVVAGAGVGAVVLVVDEDDGDAEAIPEGVANVGVIDEVAVIVDCEAGKW